LEIDRGAGIYAFNLNGQRVHYPSVTRIMDPIYDRKAPEYALERGRMVHKACALMDGWGDGSGLDLASLHPVLIPYVEAYSDYKRLTGFQPVAIEEPIICHKLRLGGTPDRYTMDATLLDLKCGGVKGWEGIQLAAYERLLRSRWRENGPAKRIVNRVTLHLFPNGRWKLEAWKDPSDWRVFAALMEVHNWKERQ
jgi:hypothetical protein